MNNTKPLITNLIDQKQLAEAKIKEQSREKTIISDMVWLMTDHRGRRFVAWFLDQSGVDHASYTGERETFFIREGARNMGLMLKSKIDEAAPDMYIKMLQETLERNRDANA